MLDIVSVVALLLLVIGVVIWASCYRSILYELRRNLISIAIIKAGHGCRRTDGLRKNQRV